MTNKILFERISVLLIAIVVISGCKKYGNEVSAKPNGGSYFGAIENASIDPSIKRDGIFFFQTNVSNNSPRDTGSSLFIGNFYDAAAGKPQTGGGPVIVAGKELIADSLGSYNFSNVSPRIGFYGKTIVFSLTAPVPISGNSVTVTDSLYSPASILFTNIPPLTPIVVQLGSTIPITWNTDPRNTKGVVVMADYLPTLYQNREALANGYKEALSNTIVLPDNGSATLPANFLAGFPKSAKISLWIARGNFKLIKYNNSNYEIGGYSASAIWEVSLQ